MANSIRDLTHPVEMVSTKDVLTGLLTRLENGELSELHLCAVTKSVDADENDVVNINHINSYDHQNHSGWHTSVQMTPDCATTANDILETLAGEISPKTHLSDEGDMFSMLLYGGDIHLYVNQSMDDDHE